RRRKVSLPLTHRKPLTMGENRVLGSAGCQAASLQNACPARTSAACRMQFGRKTNPPETIDCVDQNNQFAASRRERQASGLCSQSKKVDSARHKVEEMVILQYGS